jgi:hypothetical protein
MVGLVHAQGGALKAAVYRIKTAVQNAMDDPMIARRLAEIGADTPPTVMLPL